MSKSWFTVCSLVFMLTGCEAAGPVSTPQPAAIQQAPAFRWSVLVSRQQLGIQALTPRQPLALEQVQRVWVGETLIERAAISAPTTVTPAVAAWREQLQTRNAELAKERADTLKQQAADAEQRRLAAEDKRKREQTAQAERLGTQSLPETSPETSDTPPYRLSYLGSGRFLLESTDGGELPDLVRMEVSGFTEPLTVPVLTATQTPLVVAASQNEAGQTLITGGITPPPSDLPETGQPFFSVRYDAEGIAYLDWAGSGTAVSTPLASADAAGDGSAETPDPIAQQMALIDQLFSRLESSFQETPGFDTFSPSEAFESEAPTSEGDEEIYSA